MHHASEKWLLDKQNKFYWVFNNENKNILCILANYMQASYEKRNNNILNATE